MILFPNTKINLGLYVLDKRADGFHNIETVFYPVKWNDIVEVTSSQSEPFELKISGLSVNGSMQDNILFKVWEKLGSKYSLPPIKVNLYKNIPMGAGLGGGSADAAYFLQILDKKFDLKLGHEEKRNLLGTLGSDCAFFLENKPVFAEGKGDQFSPLQVNLDAYYIAIVWPGVHSDTRLAYAELDPSRNKKSTLKTSILETPVEQWSQTIENHFEYSVMKKFPVIAQTKEEMYKKGAVFASMSGSGSAVFGIFTKRPELTIQKDFHYFLQEPQDKFL